MSGLVSLVLPPSRLNRHSGTSSDLDLQWGVPTLPNFGPIKVKNASAPGFYERSLRSDHDMEGTLEVLSQFHELTREQLRKLCGNDRAFSQSVKMVALADMTNFSATINAGELVLSAICHTSQE